MLQCCGKMTAREMEIGWLRTVFPMSPLECKVLKSLFSSNQGSPLRSYNRGSVPHSQSHVPVAFPSQSPSTISWLWVPANLIFLLARSVSREALSPKTERGSNWPCRRQPRDSRWKKCPSFLKLVAPTPAALVTASRTNGLQILSRGGKIC